MYKTKKNWGKNVETEAAAAERGSKPKLPLK